MEKNIKIIEYDKQKGVFKDDVWTDQSVVSIRFEKKTNEIIIKANEEGFIAMSKIFLGFAFNEIPKGHHMHIDSVEMGGDLSEKSNEIVIYKINKENK